jgi:hypothetical protein
MNKLAAAVTSVTGGSNENGENSLPDLPPLSLWAQFVYK